MSFQSKTKLSKCYYCGEIVKDEYLKFHCKNIHSAAKRVAGERSVDSFFGAPASSKVSKTSVESSSSTSGECLLLSGGRKTPEDLIFTGPAPDEDVIEPLIEVKETADKDPVKELVKLVKDIAVKSDDSCDEIKLLRESIANLASKLEKKIPEFAKPDEVGPYDERINALRDCKTVEDIVETFEELVVEENTGLILCELCFVEKESIGNKKPGQFKFDGESIEVHDEVSKMSRSFINLKANIKRRFKTVGHIEN